MAEVRNNTKIIVSARSGRSSSLKILVGVGIFLFIISGAAWCLLVRNTPENTFEAMLDNGFRTASVTRQVEQVSSNQKMAQIVRIQNLSEHVAWGRTAISQDGGATKVVTESIGTPNADYVRYVQIQTEQKNQQGKELDFDSTLNVWGKNQSEAGGPIGDLYGDSSLGLFLFADLSASQRNQMLDLIEKNNVYETDYNSAKRIFKNGRPYYIYRVSIKPSAYIAMLKQFGIDTGLQQLSTLDPSAYEDAQPQVFDVAVDILSQRLTKVTTVSGNRQETYSGYGIIQEIKIPTDAIPLQELQERLQASASA